MQGQIDMFAFMQQEREPQILLSKGQKVYITKKAEVIKCTVSGKSWICGDDNRGYSLTKENGSHEVVWNSKILGQEAFVDYESARAKAEEYLRSHSGIILAEDIKPISITAFSYIRDVDSREMTAFYCDLGDEMYYVKEFMTYHHIIKGKKAIKKFMEQQEFEHCSTKEIDGFLPHFKNMYKCTEQSDWEYAECDYCYAVG